MASISLGLRNNSTYTPNPTNTTAINASNAATSTPTSTKSSAAMSLVPGKSLQNILETGAVLEPVECTLDSAVINEWRFLRLKEYKESNIEVENDAFDCYMHNFSLLEEVFFTNSTPSVHTEEGHSTENSNSVVEDTNDRSIAGLKSKLRSSPIRTANFRKQMQNIVDQR
ncbi:unnamed protein product [Ilex paraguariensis]|uniref:Uncharacterized protein n=1 Tax=Ilex paraguariensis TaxID=185542 RepID=A0ABC8TT52_9AQUA